MGLLKNRENPALNLKPIELSLKIIPVLKLMPKFLNSEFNFLFELGKSLVIFVAKSKPPFKKKE